jgi:hypothetical protein
MPLPALRATIGPGAVLGNIRAVLSCLCCNPPSSLFTLPSLRPLTCSPGCPRSRSIPWGEDEERVAKCIELRRARPTRRSVHVYVLAGSERWRSRDKRELWCWGCMPARVHVYPVQDWGPCHQQGAL